MSELETKSVPKSEIAAHGAQGWELKVIDGEIAWLQRPIVEPVPQPPTEVPLAERVVCLNCTLFSRGALNKKTGLVGGFCLAHKWSTHHLETCSKFERTQR